MTLPPSIRIGYRDYQVVSMSWQDAESNNRFGECDVTHGVIRVCPEYGTVRTGAILLHEVFHAIWDAADLGAKETEEKAVTCLAAGLAAAWRDNPDFVRFMGESLGASPSA